MSWIKINGLQDLPDGTWLICQKDHDLKCGEQIFIAHQKGCSTVICDGGRTGDGMAEVVAYMPLPEPFVTDKKCQVIK